MCKYFARLESCLIGMEACGGANYWSRKLTRLVHAVRLMALAFVNPHLKSNKSDRNGAEAVCKAIQQSGMWFVQPETP